MSLILFIETTDGLLLAGDSRLSSDANPSWHKDTAYKIFECNRKYGIAYHGVADINGVPMDEIINCFLSSIDPSERIYDIITKLRDHMTTMGSPKTIYYIMGYEDGQRRILRLDLIHNKIEDISISRYGSGGEDGLAWEMISNYYDPHLSCQSALTLAGKIFYETCNTNHKVGDKIDVLLINHSETQWIQRK